MLEKPWYRGLKINEVMKQDGGLILACNDGTVFNARLFAFDFDPRGLRGLKIKKTFIGEKGLRLSFDDEAEILITAGHIVEKGGRTLDIDVSSTRGLIRERPIYLKDGI